MEAQSRCTTWTTLWAFAIIYFVWGSTFLAIRVRDGTQTIAASEAQFELVIAQRNSKVYVSHHRERRLELRLLRD